MGGCVGEDGSTWGESDLEAGEGTVDAASANTVAGVVVMTWTVGGGCCAFPWS